ncbi:mCG1041378, partial [Mus musculus]
LLSPTNTKVDKGSYCSRELNQLICPEAAWGVEELPSENLQVEHPHTFHLYHGRTKAIGREE